MTSTTGVLNRSPGSRALSRRSISTFWPLTGGLLGLLTATLVCAPAQWLASSIAVASEGRVLLQAPRGTVWAGSAQLLLSGGEGSAGAVRLPSRISWTLAPTWLGASIQLSAPTALQLNVTLKNLSTVLWTLETAQLDLPAELLAGLGSPWNTLQLAGMLTLKTTPTQPLSGTWSNSLGLQALTGAATLDAVQMQTALSTVRPLGSYRMTLQGVDVKLETPQADSALLLSGTGTMVRSSTSKAYFLGEATAAAGREAALSNLLHIMGQKQPSSDGRLRTSLRIG
jgi:general secretion pathway protein N